MVQGRGAEEVALVCQGSGQEGVEGGLDMRDGSQFTWPLATALQLQHNCMYIHVLMRDEKEERKKQARSNKQTKQSNTAHVHVLVPSKAGTKGGVATSHDG